MEKKRGAPAKKYSAGGYEIEHGIFNSEQAFLHFFPRRAKD
jgi:hypothetical protein